MGQFPRFQHLRRASSKDLQFEPGVSYSAVVSDAIKTAKNNGRLVVAEAGDNNESLKYHPGADVNALGVAATEENDRRAHFSNFDTTASKWVDISAPGWNIFTTTIGDQYDYLHSTSMASPIVAGVAARVWAKFPNLSINNLRLKIQQTADPTQGYPRAIKRVNLYRALGGSSRTIQGRVFNAAEVTPMAGATVVVRLKGGSQVCKTSTNAAGFYACKRLPNTGRYVVSARKDMLPAIGRTFNVDTRRFNANLAMTRELGTKTDKDWTITLLWKGSQPYEDVGREVDLWLVDQDRSTCFNAWKKPSDTTLWNVMMPRDSYGGPTGQTEAAWIKKDYGGKLQVWVTLWDGDPWPASARITGSGLEVQIYKNNKLVKRIFVPITPTTSDADNLLVGTINLDANTFWTAKKIKTDAELPACVYAP